MVIRLRNDILDTPRRRLAEPRFEAVSARRWRLIGRILPGHLSRRLRRVRGQRAKQAAEQGGVRAVGSERQFDPARSLLDPHCDLQQSQPDGGELAAGQRLWLGIALRTVSMSQ